MSGAEPIFLNFLELLLENHRMPAIFRIRRGYDTLWESHNRLLPVSITSAVELDDTTVSHIGDKIAEQTGRKVELSSAVEPDILGGIVVRVGNQGGEGRSLSIDGDRSVRSPLHLDARRGLRLLRSV